MEQSELEEELNNHGIQSEDLNNYKEELEKSILSACDRRGIRVYSKKETMWNLYMAEMETVLSLGKGISDTTVKNEFDESFQNIVSRPSLVFLASRAKDKGYTCRTIENLSDPNDRWTPSFTKP